MIDLRAILAICLSAAPAAAASFQVGPAGPVAELAVPLRTVIDRKYDGVVRQRYDFSCGSAALATLLRYHYGRRVDEADVFRGMWAKGDRPAIRRLGFSLLDMKRYLAAGGIKADGFKVPLVKVAEVGLPGIALISVRNYKHFVVVKGISDTRVLLGDPSSGMRTMPRAEFERAWNGVYFVLAEDEAAARSRFNVRAQWASVGTIAPNATMLDPPSVQALQLSQPFIRDF